LLNCCLKKCYSDKRKLFDTYLIPISKVLQGLDYDPVNIIIHNYFTRKLIEFYRLLRRKCSTFFAKTSQSGLLFFLIVPRDVKQLNFLLLGESEVGNVGQKRVKSLSLFLLGLIDFLKILFYILG